MILLTTPLALLLGACTPKPDETATTGSASASAAAAASLTAATRLYAQVLSIITTRAAFASPDPARVTQQTISAYLAMHDAYSGYLTRDEYAKYRELGSGPYGGVGMDLERHRNGDTLCFPLPGSPAERAGIVTGERLESINGVPVRGKPLAVLATLVTGREGTPVELVVYDASGSARRVNIVRALVEEPGVTQSSTAALRVVKIARFTLSTRSQIELALGRLSPGEPLVIDLRGCGGGDFHGALDTAMLFLSKGLPIVHVTGRDGTTLYASTVIANVAPRAIFLWQDEQTASAAEVLIGALTDNARAVSIGTQSAGKGTRQDFIELADGSALILTTGYLSTPRGFAFNGRGLAPMRALALHADTAAYARATLPSE